MKFLFRVLKIFLIIIGIPSVLLIGAVCVVLVKPSIMLNDKTLLWAQHYSESKKIPFTWQQGHLEVESISFFKKKFHIDLSGACFSQENKVKACFDHISVNFVVHFKEIVRPVITEIGPLIVKDGNLNLDLKGPPGKKEKQQASTPDIAKWLGWIEQARWVPSRIENFKWKIETNEGPISGRLSMYIAATKIASGIHFRGDFTLRRNATRIMTRLSGHISKNGVEFGISGTAKKMIPELNTLEVRSCIIGLARTKSEFMPIDLQTSCKLFVRLNTKKTLSEILKTIHRMELPESSEIDIGLHGRSSSLIPSADSLLNGDGTISIRPESSRQLNARINVGVEFSGRVSEPIREWKLGATLDGRIEILKFKRFSRSVLSLFKDVAIPAPFNALRGNALISLKGRFEFLRGTVPIELTTHLRSKSQKLNLQARGAGQLLSFSPFKSRINAQISMEDVALELPNLNVTSIPQFFPDTRIRNASLELTPAERGEPAVMIDLTFLTPPGHPAMVKTNLISEPVPVDANFRIKTDEPFTGTFGIRSIPIQFFKVKGQLNYLTVHLLGPNQGSPISGEFHFAQPDYTISVLLFGTAEKPVIKFVSTPALRDDQIIAYILFGTPIDEQLSPDESASVASTQAAVADSALGLASFFLLASTPVESISYDPQLRTVSARLRLGQSLSLILGSGASGTAEVGLRKRLGRNWTIITTLNDPTTSTNPGVVSTYLQWDHRY